MFVDSHCHLTSLPGPLDDVVHAMSGARVERALCICVTLDEFPQVRAITERYANVWGTVGVHPDEETAQEPDVDTLVALAAHPRILAIGETGLDYYRLNGRSLDDMAWQRERFRVHIRAAREARKPLVVHTREAAAHTLQIIQEEGADTVGGVFHCFTESDATARAALELGFYISFSGILSFKTAQALRDVAAWVPLERCLIETDSPYLAPVPFRGKPNQPAYVPHVAQALALAKGLTIEEIALATTANFDRLFACPTSPTRPQVAS